MGKGDPLSTFTNSLGDRWACWVDEALHLWLAGSDHEWEEHQVHFQNHTGLVLDQPERIWLEACIMVVQELRQARREEQEG